MQKDLNLMFECKYMKNPKMTIVKSYRMARSLHGARIIKEIKSSEQPDIFAILIQDMASNAYIINGIDEKGQENVLMGDTILKVIDNGTTNFYFHLDQPNNRELKLGTENQESKSKLYKIDVEKTLKQDIISAKAVSPVNDEYEVFSFIYKSLTQKETEA